eukprot:TRINITY_DN257_c0_g1_i2.p1 TRINITY_DN257_c0_g1~~TRINITY_DN257_c0_g1_i2.p1  ORF type:complete len:1093 (+),score=193.29 TRINITY_DN257_c0_g1_i2:407-3280(+)
MGAADDSAAGSIVGVCGDARLDEYAMPVAGCCSWGSWGATVKCRPYYAIYEIQLKVEGVTLDNTALNSLRARCRQAWDPCGGCFNGSCDLSGTPPVCDCLPGYVHKNATTCVIDINECVNGTHNCEEICTDTVDSYTCSCGFGAKLNVDGHHCDCLPGYQKLNDIDECLNQTHNCDQICTNTNGSFTCSCRSGFGRTNRACKDIDECFTYTHLCEQYCSNSIGSYNCSCEARANLNVDGYHCDCKDGYQKLNGACQDIDECFFKTHNCEQYCSNTIGSFICLCDSRPLTGVGQYCECMTGYEKINGTCQDIDECLNQTHNCEQKCTNTNGSYYCSCDITSNFKLNVDGYHCDCINGYQKINSTCKDIDECLSHTHNCEHFCTNSIGSYNCSCDSRAKLNVDRHHCDCINGFQKLTGTCQDINECLAGTHNCTQKYQICINTDGSWSCPCDEGCIESDGQCKATPCQMITSKWTLNCLRSSCSQERNYTIIHKSPLCPVTPNEIIPYSTDQESVHAMLVFQEEKDNIINFLQNQLRSLEVTVIDITKSQSYDSAITVNYNYQQTKRNIQGQCPNITEVLLGSAQTIFPTIEPSRFVILNDTNQISQCSTALQIVPLLTPADRIELIIIIVTVCGGGLLIIIITVSVICCKVLGKDDYATLPEEVRKYYDHGRDHPSDWIKSDTEPVYYKREIHKEEEHNEICGLLKKLDGEGIDLQTVEAVYNPTLVSSFCNYRSIIRFRRASSPATFNKKHWNNDPLKDFVIKNFEQKVRGFDWNTENDLAPIIPVVHGTSRELAEKIVQNGFAATSQLDAGFYGKGIYFSTSTKYITPYFAPKKHPAILICWLIPGNPFPVTENPHQENNLSGHAIFPGYQSHYVLTSIKGLPITSTEPEFYDEIVIEQEQLVVAAFMLTPSQEAISKLQKKFQREIVTNINEEKNTAGIPSNQNIKNSKKPLDVV